MTYQSVGQRSLIERLLQPAEKWTYTVFKRDDLSRDHAELQFTFNPPLSDDELKDAHFGTSLFIGPNSRQVLSPVNGEQFLRLLQPYL